MSEEGLSSHRDEAKPSILRNMFINIAPVKPGPFAAACTTPQACSWEWTQARTRMPTTHVRPHARVRTHGTHSPASPTRPDGETRIIVRVCANPTTQYEHAKFWFLSSTSFWGKASLSLQPPHSLYFSSLERSRGRTFRNRRLFNGPWNRDEGGFCLATSPLPSTTPPSANPHFQTLGCMHKWLFERMKDSTQSVYQFCLAKRSLQLINNMPSPNINGTDDNYHLLSVLHVPDAFTNI